MSASQPKLNLPWHQYDHYWIVLFPQNGLFADEVSAALQSCGMMPGKDGFMAVRTDKAWKKQWDEIHTLLEKHSVAASTKASVIPGETLPDDLPEGKSVKNTQSIAKSMWLGDALLEDRVTCYLQPVLSAKDKVFGYESFARVKGKDDKIIGGGKIVEASRAMNIEYMIDRLLHVQAIDTFASSDFNGFLFVNFFPGFIHRPAVYLEGLSETAKQHGIMAKHIVLDFTHAEDKHDMKHLMNVCEYCRSKGYSIALDDVESLDGARKLVLEIRPDFVKLDMHLVHQAAEPGKRMMIKDIVEIAHQSGGTVIAEGIETEEMHAQLAELGVDLFQGYFFSPPVPVEEVLQKSAAG